MRLNRYSWLVGYELKADDEYKIYFGSLQFITLVYYLLPFLHFV